MLLLPVQISPQWQVDSVWGKIQQLLQLLVVGSNRYGRQQCTATLLQPEIRILGLPGKMLRAFSYHKTVNGVINRLGSHFDFGAGPFVFCAGYRCDVDVG